MYLEGTGHIVIFYIIMALNFGVLTYYFGWWKDLSDYLNRYDMNSRQFQKFFIIFLLMAIVVFFTTMYHNFLFFPGDERNLLFIFLTLFFILPVSASISGVVPIISRTVRVHLGDLSIFVVFFGCLGLAASRVHDVVFCARATDFYTRFNPGYELAPWVQRMNAPTYDYRVFGTYMLIEMIVLVLVSHSIYFSVKKRGREGKSGLMWAWLGTAFLAIGITILDFPWLFRPTWLHTFIQTAFMLLSVPAFYLSGKGIYSVISVKKSLENSPKSAQL